MTLAISARALSNRLRLNLFTTKAIIFGNNRLVNDINTPQLHDLSDGTSDIYFETSVRNLGVILDSKLTFQHHIAGVSSRVNGVMSELQQLRDYTDVSLRKSLVVALVLPYIDYCLVALIGADAVKQS